MTLPERAAGVIPRCEASGTRYVSPLQGVAVEPRGEMATASIRRSEAGLDGMVSKCELPINAVTSRKPKVLCRVAEGLYQKVGGPEQGLKSSLPQISRPPAERQDLNHLGACAERVKPVVLPQGKASREASRLGCG